MGIPYSKEINTAFVELNKAYGQVTPLVEAGFEVLETTKNITLVVAGIQVLNSVLLAFVLLALLGLLITMNPDMETERAELVTPFLKWVTGFSKAGNIVVEWFGIVSVMFLVILMGLGFSTTRHGEWVWWRIKRAAGKADERSGYAKVGGDEVDGEAGSEGNGEVTVSENEQNAEAGDEKSGEK